MSAKTPRFYLAVDVDEIDRDWWIEASPADRGVWLTASLICKRGLTDGFVSRTVLRREGVNDDDIERLVKLGRFVVDDDGRIYVEGFTDTNMTSAEYAEKKRKDAERQARSRANRSVTRDSDVTDCDPSQRRDQIGSQSEANPSDPDPASAAGLGDCWEILARRELRKRRAAKSAHLRPIDNEQKWLATVAEDMVARYSAEVPEVLSLFVIDDASLLADVLDGSRDRRNLTRRPYDGTVNEGWSDAP